MQIKVIWNYGLTTVEEARWNGVGRVLNILMWCLPTATSLGSCSGLFITVSYCLVVPRQSLSNDHKLRQARVVNETLFFVITSKIRDELVSGMALRLLLWGYRFTSLFCSLETEHSWSVSFRRVFSSTSFPRAITKCEKHWEDHSRFVYESLSICIWLSELNSTSFIK